MTWPRIVADALRPLDRLAAPAAQRTREVPLDVALQRLDAAMTPARSGRTAPAFLLPHQIDPWRRTLAALDAWGGAALFEPVGSGKTWIALAVALAEPEPAIAIVPAIVQAQWRDAAVRAGVRIDTWTHERLSRGTLPPIAPGLVIIDEAHRLRDVATRRVRTLAPWLPGRRTLLLTATPIVNRIADFVALLRLCLPEDALAADGILGLGELEGCVTAPQALRRVAIRSGAAAPLFQGRAEALAPDRDETARGEAAAAVVESLALSSDRGTRRLLASVFLDAAASSDAALQAALRRYRALLLQARDAGGASRAVLRRFAGPEFDQLVFWSLLEPDQAAERLPLDDLVRIDAALHRHGDDTPWISALLSRCADDRPTVCFVRHRATARLLRAAMGDHAAWVTGDGAGIGPHRLVREMVLGAFGPARAEWTIRRRIPRWLIATDVAAEGLDLQGATRVVHADLPWTAMRLAQREGRLLRLGQSHRDVELLLRVPPPAIEKALRPLARVGSKADLARRWLGALETPDAIGDDTAPPTVTMLAACGPPAALIGVEVECGSQRGITFAIRTGAESWRFDPDAARDFLARASGARSTGRCAVDVAETAAAAERATLAHLRYDAAPPSDLIARIHALARGAARRRDGPALARLDRLLRFVSASPTCGMRMIVAAMRDATDAALQDWSVPIVPCNPVFARSLVTILLRADGRHDADRP
ncbi:MAG: helicase-related protein [Gemmatimonadales bacterium]